MIGGGLVNKSTVEQEVCQIEVDFSLLLLQHRHPCVWLGEGGARAGERWFLFELGFSSLALRMGCDVSVLE